MLKALRSLRTLGPLGAVAALYLLGSAITFVAYALDKRAAMRGRRRIPEKVLHLLEALFGWPGALAAQRLLHHKSRKTRYQVVFWAIVLLHAAGWILGILRRT